ncbi:MAG: 30S ribosomal protein S3, partial [Chloroflexi bacterium]
GQEIARRVTLHEGSIPLHTLIADVDYGFTEAHTTTGKIGVKVWIYKGNILPEVAEVGLESAPVKESTE